MEGPERNISRVEKGANEELEATRRRSAGGDSIFNVRKLEHPTTDLDTLIHLVKGSLGAGILAMPLAFMNAGLSFGIVATFFIGLVCTHCVHILVETAHGLCRKHRIPSLSYGGTAEAAFLNGPKALRKFSTIASHAANSLVAIVAIGGCSVYLVFVSTNVQQVVDYWTGQPFPLRGYIALALIPVVMLCYIRNLRLLSPFSLASNVLSVGSLGIAFSYFFTDMPDASSRPNFSSVAQLPIFFSTAVFALEGIGVIMPLENNMKDPRGFTGCFRVLNTGMFIVISLYAAVGFYGYLSYGNLVKGSISLNLPGEQPLAQASKLMVAVAVCFSYPLHMYVPVHMCWPPFSKKLGMADTEWRGPFQPEHLFRLTLVLFIAIVALAVPALDSLMGLIGAVCLSSAGIMFPAIIETVYRYENLGKFKWVLVKNILIVLFGALGFATGMVTSVESVIKSFTTNQAE